jgi:ubiquinone/menaquinone biosynthesis C-methylase UbiE
MTNSFDARAKTWDEQPRRVQLAADIFSALEKHIPLQRDWTALDYGAGTGLLTLALAPRVRRVVAVDSSPGMLEVLGEKAEAFGLPNVGILLADFSKDPLPAGPYDLVASAMTLHHVADIDALLRKFFSLLGSGGHLALADLDAEDGTFHESGAGIHHLGFDRAAFAKQLAAAGFASIQFDTAARTEKNGREYSVFLAAARKP